MSDPLARAYASLGLAPGASTEKVRQQYKALVRRWHPDRFAHDSRGQAEAAGRMREINAAYQVLMAAGGPHGPRGGGAPARPTRAEGVRLSREEIEGMVRALGAEGPVDTALTFLSSVGRLVGMALGAIALLVLAVRLGAAFLQGNLSAVRGQPRLLVYAVLVGIALVAWHRRLPARREGEEEDAASR